MSVAREIHDQPGAQRIRNPRACVAIGLELDAHRAALRARVAALCAPERAGEVLDVVPVLVCEDVRLSEVA